MASKLPPNRHGLELMVDHHERIAKRLERCLRPMMDYFDCSFVHVDYVTEDGRT